MSNLWFKWKSVVCTVHAIDKITIKVQTLWQSFTPKKSSSFEHLRKVQWNFGNIVCIVLNWRYFHHHRLAFVSHETAKKSIHSMQTHDKGKSNHCLLLMATKATEKNCLLLYMKVLFCIKKPFTIDWFDLTLRKMTRLFQHIK